MREKDRQKDRDDMRETSRERHRQKLTAVSVMHYNTAVRNIDSVMWLTPYIAILYYEPALLEA